MIMSRHFPLSSLARVQGGGPLLTAAAMFVVGLVVGATVGPSLSRRAAEPIAGAQAATLATVAAPASWMAPISQRLDPRLLYPAEVLRIIDGDTFEARVRVWPGLDVDTKVRLRGIDAAELHARCDDERVKAEAARVALENILADGGITISQVGIDKYGGRVDATISTRNTADVSAAMLNGGFARSYDGGRRGTWCG
jgi:endonuclease YncB( thermonuclease family)